VTTYSNDEFSEVVELEISFEFSNVVVSSKYKKCCRGDNLSNVAHFGQRPLARSQRLL